MKPHCLRPLAAGLSAALSVPSAAPGLAGPPPPSAGPKRRQHVKGAGPPAGRGPPLLTPTLALRAGLPLTSASSCSRKQLLGDFPGAGGEGGVWGPRVGLPAWIATSSLNYLSIALSLPKEESTKHPHPATTNSTPRLYVPGERAKPGDPKVGGNSHQFDLAAR